MMFPGRAEAKGKRNNDLYAHMIAPHAGRLLLAHGAGAGFDADFMVRLTDRLGEAGVDVIPLEFEYMAAARSSGKRKPPPPIAKAAEEFRSALMKLRRSGSRVFIGGKSYGGRAASVLASDAAEAGSIAGLVCLGYPFHPPGKPNALRTAHLESLRTPTLIVQGSRDPFGSRDEVGAYALSPSIRIHWLDDGDHDLKPRVASGHTHAGNIKAAAIAIAGFMRSVDGRARAP